MSLNVFMVLSHACQLVLLVGRLLVCLVVSRPSSRLPLSVSFSVCTSSCTMVSQNVAPFPYFVGLDCDAMTVVSLGASVYCIPLHRHEEIFVQDVDGFIDDIDQRLKIVMVTKWALLLCRCRRR